MTTVFSTFNRGRSLRAAWDRVVVENEVSCESFWPWSKKEIGFKTAIFRQVNLDKRPAHHDALEFPDGRVVLLTFLQEHQRATVLQLPAAGVKAPQRMAYV